jgi:hypothetical protein
LREAIVLKIPEYWTIDPIDKVAVLDPTWASSTGTIDFLGALSLKIGLATHLNAERYQDFL